LTARLEKTILSEKMIEQDSSQVEKSATKSTYRLSVRFERCEDKGEKSAPKFILSSTYHKEEATIKFIKAQYPFNLKSSFNPKRKVRKETPNPRDEAFICMFCSHAGHLDEFCFRQKRIKRRHIEYARDSYRDEFFDVPPQSYSHILPCSYSRALSHTFSRALPQFGHRPNIAHMVLVHERTILSLDVLVMTHVLIVVTVSRVGLIFPLEGHSPTLS
jgi:hypothetical protein